MLNGISSAALAPKTPILPPPVTLVWLPRCAVTMMSSLSPPSCAIAGIVAASVAAAAERPSAMRALNLVTFIPLESAAAAAQQNSGPAGAHRPADGTDGYRQRDPGGGVAQPVAGQRNDQPDDAGDREQQRDGEDRAETLFLHSAGASSPPLSTSRTS